jgi:hypothetical protein
MANPQYDATGHGDKLFAAACHLGLEGIVSKKLNAPYRSGPSSFARATHFSLNENLLLLNAHNSTMCVHF